MKRRILFPLILLATLGACHSVKPDQFLDAVVDCAQVNPAASAALAQVETCLLGAVSGNAAVCLSGLVTAAHFTVEEVACVVAWIAQQENDKVATSQATLDDLKLRQAAVDWLTQERIAIRNSYRAP